MRMHHSVLALMVATLAACSSSVDSDPNVEPIGQSAASATTTGGGIFSGLTVDTTGALHKVVVTSSVPLIVNSPYYGITILQNGSDVSDDISDVAVATGTPESGSAWSYTFATKKFAPTDTVEVRLNNAQRAVPGHYVAVPEVGSSVDDLYQRLVDCQGDAVPGPNGAGDCAGQPKMPNLVAGVKGFSRRYQPRDIVSPSGDSADFSSVFADAKFMAKNGKKLNVIFTLKTFNKPTVYPGDGANRTFAIADDRWHPELPVTDRNRGRNREVHVYYRLPTADPKAPPPLVEVAHPDTKPLTTETNKFWFSSGATAITLGFVPLVGSEIQVVYARDPFPAYVWNTMDPKPYGWFAGSNPDHQSFGFVHKPWETTAQAWLASFMKTFRDQWDAAIVNDDRDGAPPTLATAIESVTLQETANTLANEAYDNDDWTVRNKNIDGLAEYAKTLARAVRGRALPELLINQVAGQNKNRLNASAKNEGLRELANKIIPWGARLGGPDLMNFDTGKIDIPNEDYGSGGLEFGVYDVIHREQHNRALTMIWAQNDSHAEGKPGGGFFTMEDQYKKAQSPIGVPVWSPTAGVQYYGLEAEYVFWNITPKKYAAASGWQDSFRVIANHPTIQTTGNNRNRWRRLDTTVPIPAQWVKRQP